MPRLFAHLARNLAAFLVVLLLAGWVQAAPPPAGTVITSTATAAYVDSATGLNVRLTSNTVRAVVQPLEALQLVSSQALSRTPNTGFTFAHQLTNTGNVSTTYTLTLSSAGGSFAPTGLAIVQDTNGNGVADPGEPVLSSGGTVTLAPGVMLNLLVMGTVPVTASAGQAAQIRLSATSVAQGATASNTDTVNVVSGAAVSVTKSASTATPAQGGSLGYTLSAQNSGAAAAAPVAVTVNGAAGTLFVLRDAIPANTVFASLSSSTPGAQLLYHRLGDPAGTYVTTPPAAGGVDGVAWGLATLPAGSSLVGNFSVTVNGNASGMLVNTGYADYSAQGANFTSASNPVQLPLAALAPTITFYTSSTYATPVQQSLLDAPLFVQVNAAQCNIDPTMVETHPITLVSQLTGDTETFTATETAANSGIFRILPNVPTANGAIHIVASGDGILEVLRNDHVTASLAGCGGSSVTTTLLIDPSGVVFDSKSNAPLAGATVQLIDVTGAGNGGNAGGPAKVFQADGVTPAPSSMVTAVDGSYNFPFVPASTYRLLITPPNGYAFPSKLPAGLLPPGRSINPTGSYGGNFAVTGSGGPVTVDVPLDTGAANGLFIQKIASKSVAEIGDFVNYSITINNNTGTSLMGAVVNDSLPAGFSYVKGTARLNGAPLADPVGGAGPALVFGLGAVAASIQPVLTYRVRIGPGGDSGNGINTAQVVSGVTRSNQATAKVQVSGGVFSNKAYLIGKVFVDCNANRIQDPGEPGIPGVRIYLDNGMYAVTDSEGKYSLYGLTPRTHVAKVDDTSLPKGASLQILNNRNAGDAGSQFVDLRNGELHKADFAIAECTPDIRAQIAARQKAMLSQPAEIALAATAQINLQTAAVSDARTLPAAGIIGQQAMQQPGAAGAGRAAVVAAPVTAGVAAAVPVVALAPEAPALAAAPLATLKDLLSTLTPQVGFIDLKDGQTLPTDQTRVRVKGPLGAQLRLTVNGQELSAKQVGEQSSLESQGVGAWDYIGVNLKPGDNVLDLAALDSFGNPRGTARIHLIAPGKLAQIRIDTPAQANADGQTPVDVTVHLLDEHGVPVTSRTSLTLESSLGEWQTPDLDPKEPGVQVFVEGGVGHFALMPPPNPGKATLRISSGALRGESDLTFMPNLRPMIAAGIVEGVFNLRNLNPTALTATQNGDVFEREIQSASQSFNNGKDSAAARASLFLKGKVLGSSLLTLAYDSDKPGDTALFRDIQPNQFYGVYGDSSVKGYDAQSTGKLYVRIDHGTSYVLYGDYSTQSDNPARLLTQYSRVLNGAKTHIESGSLTVDGFASYTNTSQVIDEIAANGTSGPYQLSQINGVINSQQVDIVTRDRNQPSIVLSDVPLTLLTDYAVEANSGQILLKAPVASLDANLNPVYIRVTYEISSGGPSYWVGGVDLREKLTSFFTLGGTYIRDTNPANQQTLRGANFLWNAGPATTLVGELAQSQTDLAGTGEARRLELRHTDPKLQVRVYGVQTDPTFSNPSSTFTAGASEYGAKIGYAINDKNRLVIDAIKTTTASGSVIQSPSSIPLGGALTSIAGGGSSEGESVGLEHSLPMGLKLTTSLRHVNANNLPTQPLATGAVPNDYTSARVRLDAPVPGVPAANAFVQYEQALSDDSRKAATIGGTYQVAPQTKLYATHQSSNSLTGDYGLSPTQQSYNTVAGIDTTYMKDGQLFNEYRVGDGIDGRTAEAAIGLRNLWHIAPGLGLSTSIQRVRPISGVVTDTATAVTGALQYTANPDWKGSARLELSKSDTAQTRLATVGAAFKLNPDVTLLDRYSFNQQLSSTAGSGSIYLNQAQFGAAYRPVNSDVWNALARVEVKRSQNSTLGAGLNIDEAATILSANLNYQPSASWLMNGRYGIKRATDYSTGITSTYTAQMIGGRSTWDINSKWDAGLQYYIEFGNNDGAGRQQAIGAEVGYLVEKNLWLSVGYNVKGFTDNDLAGADYTQRGFYLRLRFKFDENLFKPRNNAQALPASAARMP
ncbi:MAG: hypothetical protein P4L96_17370 [Rhodoferax sp.]|nr:hypothetical protein [Rhodoferax sp.]